MGDVSLKITGDAVSAQKAFDQLNKQVGQLREKLAEVSETGKRGAKEHAEGLSITRKLTEDNIRAVEGMVLGIVGGGGLIAGVHKLLGAYEGWHSMMARIAEKTREALADQVALMAKAGDFARGAEIIQKVERIPGVAPAEGRRLFDKITLAGPEAPLEQRLADTRSAARAVPLIPIADLDQFALLRGQVREYTKGKTPEELTGLAVKARQLAGEHAGDLTSDRVKRAINTLTFVGWEPEKAMATMITAIEKGQGRPDALIAMAEKIEEVGEQKVPTTQADVLRNKFQAMGKVERARALQDQAMSQAVLGEASIKIRQLEPDVIARRTAELKAAQAPGFVDRQMAELRAAPQGREFLEERALKQQQARVEQRLGPQARATARDWESFQAATEEMNWPARAVARAYYRGLEFMTHLPGVHGRVSMEDLGESGMKMARPVRARGWWRRPAEEPAAGPLALPTPPADTGAPMVAPVPPAQLQGVQWQGGGREGDSVTAAVNENSDVLRDIRGEIERLTLQQRIGAAGNTGTHKE